MSGEKILSQNCFKQWEVEIYVDKTIGQLTKVRTPRRLKKNWASQLRKLAAANITLHLVLTKKSELTLTIKACSHKQIWADSHILRSRSSPNFLKLSPSPITVQNFFQLSGPSPKHLKNVAFSQQKCRIFFPLNSVQVRSGSWILKRFTVRVQSKFNKICYSPDPAQSKSNAHFCPQVCIDVF